MTSKGWGYKPGQLESGPGEPYASLGGYARDETVIWLPHSCDEWFIGCREEAEALIADIRKVFPDDKQDK